MNESLRERGDALIKTTGEVTDQLRETLDEMSKAVSAIGSEEATRLIDTAAEAERNIVRAGEEIKPQVEAITAAVDRAVEQSRLAGEAFRRQAEGLSQTSDQAAEQIDRVGAVVQQRSQDLTDAAREAMVSAEQLARTFKSEGEELTSAADAANVAAANLKTAVQQEIRDLGRVAGELNNLARSIKQSLSDQASELAQGMATTREASEDIREELRAQSDDLAEASEEIMDRLAQIGEKVEISSATLTERADRALDKAQEMSQVMDLRANVLSDTVQKAVADVTEVAQVFRSQTKELVSASEEAAIQARTIRHNDALGRRDLFLRTATVMIEDLNSAAIDINRLLEEEIPEDIWKRYRRGDKGVFARRLLGLKDRFQIEEIERRYENDEKFRNQVTRYMNQFESLLSQATDCDPEQVLSATFLTADVGKLYLLLSRSLGRTQ